MKLVVYGRESVDALKDMVEGIFGDVAKKELTRKEFSGQWLSMLPFTLCT